MAKWQGPNRRSKPRSQDFWYRLVVMLSVAGWVGLVMALILFDQARPEFVTGLQRYWGIEYRSEWSGEFRRYLIMCLQFCLLSSLLAVLLNVRRSRRRQDHFGINLLVLIFISFVSLLTLYQAG